MAGMILIDPEYPLTFAAIIAASVIFAAYLWWELGRRKK